jgi:hypothetical protein
MNPGQGFGELGAFVERLFFVGFSAVAFLALVVVVGLLVRFLLVATKAAEIYVRRNSPPASPRTTSAPTSTAPASTVQTSTVPLPTTVQTTTVPLPTTVPGAPPAQPGAQAPGRPHPSTASPIDPR